MQENLDLAKLIQKAAFDAGFSSFYNYLGNYSV